jgi:hypothetical protein
MGETPPPPVWTPSLYQSVTTVNGQTVYGDVYLDSTSSDGGITQTNNIYSLTYVTTFTMIAGTFAIENVPPELVSMRKTLIGVIPLINLQSTNKKNDIIFSFPTNNYAISVVRFDRDYNVFPQSSGSPYNTVETPVNSGGNSVALSYRNALVINGVYDALNGFVYGQREATFRMEMKQAEYIASGVGDDTISYAEKKIVVPIKIIKSTSSLSIKPFYGVGMYTIPNADMNGIITREYLDGNLDLIFSDFATTTRKNVNTGTDDYDNIIYYLRLDGLRSFQFSNDNITISGNRIIFKKVTLNADKITYSPIPIKFLQEETAIYDRSSEKIGEFTRTIQINIIKSTPTFIGQIPSINTGISTTIYRLADMNKMTTERSFNITIPGSTNSDPEATFTVTSSDVELLKIDVSGSIFTGIIYGPGVVTVTITQPATTNFNAKSAIFDVNIFNITSSIMNCNYNLFYTNPYNRNFWTRFKPECRSSNLFDKVNNRMLSVSEVDEVYDMRRKVEILKYNKNVGGLTKSQKYAKASRGELMRKIGNEQKYISETIGGITTLVCPPSSANSRLLCGLTTACGVPGKERLLCYDASINLYNYKRIYQYQAGLQVPSNLPTIILTEPTNLRIKSFDNINNKVTLEWDAPDSNGGLPIVGYVITFSEDNNKWLPYKSVFPYRPTNAEEAAVASYNKLSGEINGNTVVFERIPNNVEIRANTIYYISVFSGNERGLSSVPATITVKTSAVPSIINNLRFTNAADERQNLMVDLTWTDPVNTGTTAGSFIGPSIRQYNLYYRKVPTLIWTKQTLDLSSIIISLNDSQQRQYILRNLENQNKYDIKIEPINSIGVGPESTIITARTLMKPGVPQNIVVTPKYGLLPPLITTTPRNYLNVAWSKPDNGGNPITIYNISITPPTGSSIQPITILYDISNSSSSLSSYNLNITRLGQSELISGDYSIIMQAFNGYLTSNDSIPTIVTLKSTSQQPIIQSITGRYGTSGLLYSELKFSITKQWVDENTISLVKVTGLTLPYQVSTNIANQPITGTGDHIIRIPALSSMNDYIITVGQTYTNIKIILVFSLTGEERTSDAFSYTPEIRI